MLKRTNESRLLYLLDERISLLEDMMKHSGPNAMCWIVDKKKISELWNKSSELYDVTTTQEAHDKLPILKEKLRKIEEKLKTCYSYE